MAEHAPTYHDRPAALVELRNAEQALTRAALHLNEIEDDRRLSGEMTYLVGGLGQAVGSLLGVILKGGGA